MYEAELPTQDKLGSAFLFYVHQWAHYLFISPAIN